MIDTAPDQVRWLILDAGSLVDVDYSAGIALGGLLDYLENRQITFAIVLADSGLIDTLRAYDLLDRIGSHHYDTINDALAAFHGDAPALSP